MDFVTFSILLVLPNPYVSKCKFIIGMSALTEENAQSNVPEIETMTTVDITDCESCPDCDRGTLVEKAQ